MIIPWFCTFVTLSLDNDLSYFYSSDLEDVDKRDDYENAFTNVLTKLIVNDVDLKIKILNDMHCTRINLKNLDLGTHKRYIRTIHKNHRNGRVYSTIK